MTTYRKLRDIVHTANLPNVALNGSIDIDVEFLTHVYTMVEELRQSIELIQESRIMGFSMQPGIASYLTTNAIKHADLVSEKYWPKEKQYDE